MLSETSLKLAGYEDFFNTFSHKIGLCLFCKILLVEVFYPRINKHKCVPHNEDKPAQLHVTALAFNVYGHVPVEFAYSCSRAEASELHNALTGSDIHVVAEATDYYLIEGDLVLLAPTVHIVTGFSETTCFHTSAGA